MTQSKLATLVLELAAAVDNAADDVGGSRPQLTILREAVQEAHAVQSDRASTTIQLNQWRAAVHEAYGWLWHVNTEPMAPMPMWSPEQAAYMARRELRELLTMTERGNAINSVAAKLGRASADPIPSPVQADKG